jgi:hypothetical protein
MEWRPLRKQRLPDAIPKSSHIIALWGRLERELF